MNEETWNATSDLSDPYHPVTPETSDRPRRCNRMGKPQRLYKRKALLKRDGTACCWCGADIPENLLTIEHLKPLSRGGNNHMDNLALACRPCNQRRGRSAGLRTLVEVCDEPKEAHMKAPRLTLDTVRRELGCVSYGWHVMEICCDEDARGNPRALVALVYTGITDAPYRVTLACWPAFLWPDATVTPVQVMRWEVLAGQPSRTPWEAVRASLQVQTSLPQEYRAQLLRACDLAEGAALEDLYF
jgi:5-methylcytosine-specific restriction endonuclease McrA